MTNVLQWRVTMSNCSDQSVLRFHILIKLCTSHLFYIHISNEWGINAFLPSTYRASIICIEKKTLLRTFDSFLHFISVGWCNIYIFLPTRCPFELIMIHAGLMWCAGHPSLISLSNVSFCVPILGSKNVTCFVWWASIAWLSLFI